MYTGRLDERLDLKMPKMAQDNVTIAVTRPFILSPRVCVYYASTPVNRNSGLNVTSNVAFLDILDTTIEDL